MARRVSVFIWMLVGLGAIASAGVGAAPGPLKPQSTPVDVGTDRGSALPSGAATATNQAAPADVAFWVPPVDAAGSSFERRPTLNGRRAGLGAVAAGGFVPRAAAGEKDGEAAPRAAEDPVGRVGERRTAEPTEVARERLSRVADDAYRIARSGRPSASLRSSLAYDGDPGTSWAMDGAAGSGYAWFDLGDERAVAAVRWQGGPEGGRVEIQVSSDGSRWETVGERSLADRTWQSIRVDGAARYVRFVFDGSGDGVGSAELAEVEIYGPPGADVSEPREQEPRADADRSSPDEANDEPDSAPRGEVVDSGPGRTRTVERVVSRGKEDRRAGPDRSDDDRGNVRIVQPDVVEEREIEISVEPGTAVCDESGGDGNKAGRGRGASAGNGGTCREDASGGTVEMGDINP